MVVGDSEVVRASVEFQPVKLQELRTESGGSGTEPREHFDQIRDCPTVEPRRPARLFQPVRRSGRRAATEADESPRTAVARSPGLISDGLRPKRGHFLGVAPHGERRVWAFL